MVHRELPFILFIAKVLNVRFFEVACYANSPLEIKMDRSFAEMDKLLIPPAI